MYRCRWRHSFLLDKPKPGELKVSAVSILAVSRARARNLSIVDGRISPLKGERHTLGQQRSTADRFQESMSSVI
jgi:hypothetical protein